MTTDATGVREPRRASRPDQGGPAGRRPVIGTGPAGTGRPGGAGRPARRRTPATWLRRGGLSTLVFALPLILVFGIFSWWPIVRATVMSFQQTNLVTAPVFVGWDNFAHVLHDPLLPTAIANTGWFALLALVFGYPLPLVMAVLMSELRRAKGFFSALVYLPVVVPPVVAVLLWKFFYDGSATGVFNSILGFVGIPPQPWLQNAGTAMPSLVLEATWAAAGGTVIIYLAALLSVPPELYDAAEVDGARVWRKIWHVTLPQLRGVLFVTLILQVIGTAQVFLEPYLFTGGGPNNATTTVLLMIYDYAFANSTGGDYGSATALSIMLAVVLAVLSVLYFRLTKKWSV
jgi:multiple sugar transport system permease protein